MACYCMSKKFNRQKSLYHYCFIDKKNTGDKNATHPRSQTAPVRRSGNTKMTHSPLCNRNSLNESVKQFFLSCISNNSTLYRWVDRIIYIQSRLCGSQKLQKGTYHLFNRSDNHLVHSESATVLLLLLFSLYMTWLPFAWLWIPVCI